MADGGNRRTVAIVVLLYIMIAFGIVLFLITKYREKYVRCNTINNIVDDSKKDKIKEIQLSGGNVNTYLDQYENASEYLKGSNTGDIFTYNLVNLHVKSAYNCCAVKSFRNSFVSKCALISCLKLGARCLDFEIYSIGNKAVIGASSKDLNINTKESFNHLDFKAVMNIIKAYGTPYGDRNTSDYFTNSSLIDFPLILHFRIKTKNRKAYNHMAESLFSVFGEEGLMDPKFSFLNNKNTWGKGTWTSSQNGNQGANDNDNYLENNIIFRPIINRQNDENSQDDTTTINKDFKGKVIIVFNIKSIVPSASSNNSGYEDFLNLTKEKADDTDYGNIVSYINLISPSPDCDTIRNFDVENATSLQKSEFIETSKYRLLISTPTISSASLNYDFTRHIKSGIQMPCVSFQNLDSWDGATKCLEAPKNKEKEECYNYILRYHKFFKNEGAVIMKPKNMGFKLNMPSSSNANISAADYIPTSQTNW